MAAAFGSIFSRMKTITFKADERLEAQLTRLAERLGTSRSGVIRIARTSADFAAANADGL